MSSHPGHALLRRRRARRQRLERSAKHDNNDDEDEEEEGNNQQRTRGAQEGGGRVMATRNRATKTSSRRIDRKVEGWERERVKGSMVARTVAMVVARSVGALSLYLA